MQPLSGPKVYRKVEENEIKNGRITQHRGNISVFFHVRSEPQELLCALVRMRGSFGVYFGTRSTGVDLSILGDVQSPTGPNFYPRTTQHTT